MVRLFRVEESHELIGLDWIKHKEPAYPIGMIIANPIGIICFTTYKSHPMSLITKYLYGSLLTNYESNTRSLISAQFSIWVDS